MGNKTQCYVVRAGESKNELCHWKYIKREKRPNGKWRYYYDTNQLKDDIGVDELKTYNDAKTRYENAVQNKQDADYKLRTFERAMRDRSYKDYDYDRSHDLYRNSIYWKETTEKRGSEYMSARSELMKTPIGKLTPVKETIEKGTEKLMDNGGKFINRIINNAKELLKIH